MLCSERTSEKSSSVCNLLPLLSGVGDWRTLAPGNYLRLRRTMIKIPNPMAIVEVLDVTFLRFHFRRVGNWERRDLKHRHKERMIAWRPRELREFYQRMLGEDEGRA